MVAQLQREDGPATATPDERTHMRIEQLEQRADASHVAPPVFSVSTGNVSVAVLDSAPTAERRSTTRFSN